MDPNSKSGSRGFWSDLWKDVGRGVQGGINQISGVVKNSRGNRGNSYEKKVNTEIVQMEVFS